MIEGINNDDLIYKQYSEYLMNHKNNLIKGFEWLRNNFGEILFDNDTWNTADHSVRYAHDASKTSPEEYEAYALYFYSNRTYEVVANFKKAWLHHLHSNPHHWQHWVLINDDKGEGHTVLDMPNHCIIEMICDWWSFSWANGNLTEMFNWYKEREDYILLSETTKNTVLMIFQLISAKLNGF